MKDQRHADPSNGYEAIAQIYIAGRGTGGTVGEDSRFFDRSFDAVVAWGLMFLLAPTSQALLIHKAARVLQRGGRFLFTSPELACEWLDGMTDLKSVSLGAAWYAARLHGEGLARLGQRSDEGDNHYYWAEKT